MPINFTCPHCGTATVVDDQYAGQSGPCAHCGKTITVPRPDGPQPFDVVGTPQKSGLSAGWIIAIVAAAVLAVVLVCGGVLAALLLPAVQSARTSARCAACRNQMAQIALAIHSYQQQYKCFPPAFIPDKNGKPMHSWRVLLLPYFGEQGLYAQYRFDEPWDSPHNKAVAARIPSVYRCPSDPRLGSTETSYAMLVGPHAISDGPTGRSVKDITDGLSTTITVVEAAHAGISWTEPRDINADNLRFHVRSGQEAERHATDSEISSYHSGGVNAAFADGSVQFLSETIDPKILKVMTTIDGRDSIYEAAN